MSSRISEKAAKWVDTMDQTRSEGVITPWWEELKKCAEGNVVPSRTEGWNHPIASKECSGSSILSLVFSAFYSSHLCCVHNSRKSSPGSPGLTRETDRPAAVGGSHLSSLYTRYPMRSLVALGSNVCIHYTDTNLMDQNSNYTSTESLFNAVKKQYGNSYLLKLALPSPPPSGGPSHAPFPRLPNNFETSGPDTPQLPAQTESFNINLIEADLESTAQFVRELAVESLIPWMGKCISEWNEAVSCPFTPLSLRT